MVCENLCFHLLRYKTLRYFVFLVATFGLFANIFFLFPSKSPMNYGTGKKRGTFIDTRVSRVITRHHRTIVTRSRIPTHLKQDKLVNPENADDKRDPSLSSGNRDIHLNPLLSLPVECQTWCRRGQNLSPPYQLSAVLLVRVYRHDLAGLSAREMLQWLFYLRYAGFEHVFIYDAYVSKNESQYHVLSPLVQSGFITYIDWSAHNPYSLKGTQIAAYQDCMDKYGKNLTWHMAIDIDEYPFSPADVEPNFMLRFIQKYFFENPHVSQVTLQNYLFLGKPLDPQAHPLLIARLRRRTHKKANDLGKSVFRVAQIDEAKVHHNTMRSGATRDSDARVMRLNHYWGARLQAWGEDTQRILDMTEHDYSMKLIVDRLKLCVKCFGENRLYKKRWN